jgi:hypothetical protein
MSMHTISYFVRYEGEAENQEAFLAHYRDRHAPILARFPPFHALVYHQATPSEEVLSR